MSKLNGAESRSAVTESDAVLMGSRPVRKLSSGVFPALLVNN